MALFATDEVQRIYLKEVPGASAEDWVDIRVGYSADVRRRIGRRYQSLVPVDAPFDYNSYKQAVLEDIVKAWSETDPVSPDAIGSLHAKVQDYLVEEFDRLSVRTEAEVNESGSSSPLGLEQAAADSPATSGISSS